LIFINERNRVRDNHNTKFQMKFNSSLCCEEQVSDKKERKETFRFVS